MGTTVAGAHLPLRPPSRGPVPHTGPQTGWSAALGRRQAASTPASRSFRPARLRLLCSGPLTVACCSHALCWPLWIKLLHFFFFFFFGPKQCTHGSLLVQAVSPQGGHSFTQNDRQMAGRPVTQQECAQHPEPCWRYKGRHAVPPSWSPVRGRWQ